MKKQIDNIIDSVYLSHTYKNKQKKKCLTPLTNLSIQTSPHNQSSKLHSEITAQVVSLARSTTNGSTHSHQAKTEGQLPSSSSIQPAVCMASSDSSLQAWNSMTKTRLPRSPVALKPPSSTNSTSNTRADSTQTVKV